MSLCLRLPRSDSVDLYRRAASQRFLDAAMPANHGRRLTGSSRNIAASSNRLTMPRHIIDRVSGQLDPELRSQLVQELCAELKASRGVEPIILEEILGPSRSRHIQVLWSRWEQVPEEVRTDVILEAYQQAEPDTTAGDIAVAVGLTPDDALALGLLRFIVVPMWRGTNDPISREKYEQAIESERPRTLLGGRARELRYATMADAEDAVRRLESALPGSHWSIAFEGSPAELLAE